jgi:hypothetical protein
MTITIALLAPLGLVALAALALPLLIHLVRRIELRTTEFAALRWISERIRPRRRLRFERPWLLLLRLALLALFALLLARPVIDEPALVTRALVVVAPGSDLSAARAAVSIANADWRWLAPGFPSIETPAPLTPVPVASVLREADAGLPADAALAVVVPEELAGLDGERPILSHAIEWHVVPGRMAADAAPSSRTTIDLAVRYASAAEPVLKYLRAAAAALDAQGSTRVALNVEPQDVALPDTARALVWLGSDLTPAIRSWIEAGGTAIVDRASRASGVPVWRDADGGVLARAEPLGRGRLVALTNAFTPQTLPALLDADFPQHLLDLVQGTPPAPTRAPAETMHPAQGVAMRGSSALIASPKPLDAWLALLIAALILIERIVATRREAAK